MTFRNRTLAASAVVALASAVSVPALAAGTPAGTQITNTAGVTYTINSIAQTGSSATDTLTVDRVVRFTLVETGGVTTVVTPGQTLASAPFTLTNTSNAPLDFGLAAAQVSGGLAAHGGMDSFDLTGGAIYNDVNNNALYDSGTDTLIGHLDEVPADGIRNFLYVADVPAGLAHAQLAGVTITATAQEAGTVGTQGAIVTQTSGANTIGLDTVFDDGQGVTDLARDGKLSVADDFTVTNATVTISRTNKIIQNIVEGTTNAKAIPSALVEYCMIVSNAANSADAANLTITDQMASTLTYDSSFGVWVNGTVTNGVCNNDGTKTGSHAAGQITGTIGDLPSGTERTVRYRATVN